MTEIELKAHVDDRKSLIKTLTSFAKYEGSVTKDDTYYKKDGVSIRIRKETHDGGNQIFLVTYKRKETRTDDSGTSIEVNDEKECEVSSPEALTSFLTDTGYTISLTKHKEVMDWTVPLSHEITPANLHATFELCAVPPLGDFLEIEILSPVHDENTVSLLHKELETLLDKTGIPKSRIEHRYYSELLSEIK